MTMLNVKIEFHIYIHKDVAVKSLQPSSMQHEPAVEQKEPLKKDSFPFFVRIRPSPGAACLSKRPFQYSPQLPDRPSFLPALS